MIDQSERTRVFLIIDTDRKKAIMGKYAPPNI